MHARIGVVRVGIHWIVHVPSLLAVVSMDVTR